MAVAEKTITAILPHLNNPSKIGDIGALAVVASLMVDSGREVADIKDMLCASLVAEAFRAGANLGWASGMIERSNRMRQELGLGKDKNAWGFDHDSEQALARFCERRKDRLPQMPHGLAIINPNWHPPLYEDLGD